MSETSHHQVKQDTTTAIVMMCIAVFLLSGMDLGIKQLVEHYSSMQVVFLRCVVSAMLFGAWILISKHNSFRVRHPGSHLLRAVIGLFMLFGVGECFREMQLADAYAIFFTAPLLITLLSGPLLGERAGPIRVMAALVGFVGVLILLKPGMNSQLISYGAIMALLSVVAYAFTALLLRRMGHHDATISIAFWFVALVGIGAGVLAIPDWKPIQWRLDWPWLLLLAVTGTSGQLFITAAYKRASAAVVAPFDYTHMIWAVVYGYLFWGHLPGASTWLGTAVIVASGLFIIYREHRIKRAAKAGVDSVPAQVASEPGAPPSGSG